MPETGLPGLEIDLSFFAPSDNSSQMSSLWTNSPVDSLSAVSQLSTLQLELPSDIIGDSIIMGLHDLHSSKRKDVFGQVAGLGLEEGVLLRPDFEFDEDGNLVELGRRVLSPSRSRKSIGARSEVSEREKSPQGRLDDDQASLHHVQTKLAKADLV